MDFLASILHVADKLGFISNPESKFRITIAATIMLKHVWEACYNAIFNHIPINLARLIVFVENNLKMELRRRLPMETIEVGIQTHS